MHTTGVFNQRKPRNVRRIVLKRRGEIFFDILPGYEPFLLIIKKGLCEIFGIRMKRNKIYEFPTGTKISLFSWEGCEVEYKGSTKHTCIYNHSLLDEYFSVHSILEQLRREASKLHTRGPVIMILGPCDYQRAMLAKFLTNYAIRVQRQPILVNLDVDSGLIPIPDTIGALIAEFLAIKEEQFCLESPIVYCYGHDSPKYDPTLYNKLVKNLSYNVNEWLQIRPISKSSGAIINTCRWIDNSYEHVINAVKAFNVNFLVVLDERADCHVDLLQNLPANIRVKFFQKKEYNYLGKLLSRNDKLNNNNIMYYQPYDEYQLQINTKTFRYAPTYRKIRDYFYGSEPFRRPNWIVIKVDKYTIIKLTSSNLKNSRMPFEMKKSHIPDTIIPVKPTLAILHHLLGVSCAETFDAESLLTSVAGFVCVKNIDVERKFMTIIAPPSLPLPAKFFIFMDCRFIDSHSYVPFVKKVQV